MEKYLQSTPFMDYDHPLVQEYIKKFNLENKTQTELAIEIYLAIRDDFYYDPYSMDLTPKGLSASNVIAINRGFCIPKAVLLAAVARSFQIPARLGYADVKNHLSSQKLLDYLRSNLFIYHGYTELYLQGKWVKATPAFNQSLCEKFGVLPLEFNGVDDSIFQEFNHEGHKVMEYVRFHGDFSDLPFEQITNGIIGEYPHIFKDGQLIAKGDFAKEALKQPASM